MSRIEIKETIMDKNSDFNIKRYNFPGISDIELPIKTLDVKKLNRNMVVQEKEHCRKTKTNLLLEMPKQYKADSIHSLLEENEDKKISGKFGFRNWFSDYPYVISPVFLFNPFDEFKNIEEMSGFFNQYYEHSDNALLIPNVKIDKTTYEERISKKSGQAWDKPIKVRQMKFDKYKQFVEESYTLLDARNKKPIFVPFSLKFSNNEIKKLVEFYANKEYSHIWIDFDHQPTGNRAIKGRIRTLREELESREIFNDVLIFATNIKREIKSNPQDTLSPTSDALASLLGANIIGANKEAQRFDKKGKQKKLSSQERKELKEHKARLFNPETYYYYKIADSKLSESDKSAFRIENANIAQNSRLLNLEMKRQTDNFVKEYDIKPYVSNKKMLKEYNNGQLIKILFEKDTKKKLEATSLGDYF